MRGLLSYIFTTVLSIGSAYIYGKKAILPGVNNTPRIIVITFGVIAVVAIVGVLSTYWMNFTWLRRKFSKKHSIEGYWIECLHDKNSPISYAVISFDNGQFGYHGNNYDLEGRHIANFKSTSIDVSERGNKMYFEFTGNILKSRDAKNNSQEMRGHGKITFQAHGGKKYSKGDGYFIEGDGQDKTLVEMYKVPSKDIQEIFSKENGRWQKFLTWLKFNDNVIVDTQRIDQLVKHYINKEWFIKRCKNYNPSTCRQLRR